MYADADRKSAALIGPLNGDEYYGRPLTAAARMILESRRAAGRGPATINEIYDQMIAGGYQFNAKSDDNAKRSLRIAITKASHTFHRIAASGKFGLLEWYESIRPSKANGFAGKDHLVEDGEQEVDGTEPEADQTETGMSIIQPAAVATLPEMKRKPR